MGPSLRSALTGPQARVAAHNRAYPLLPGDSRSVFLYREESWATYRWLVATDGQVLETVRFLKGT
jgi:hypothetical protein